MDKNAIIEYSVVDHELTEENLMYFMDAYMEKYGGEDCKELHKKLSDLDAYLDEDENELNEKWVELRESILKDKSNMGKLSNFLAEYLLEFTTIHYGLRATGQYHKAVVVGLILEVCRWRDVDIETYIVPNTCNKTILRVGLGLTKYLLEIKDEYHYKDTKPREESLNKQIEFFERALENRK